MNTSLYRYLSLAIITIICSCLQAQEKGLTLNTQEYLEMQGLNVMLAHDYYPEGHQGGVGIIQNGLRTATNGDIRLEPTPGQWQPIPKPGKRMIDKEKQEISVRMQYPDEARNRKGFNPIEYPDLHIAYIIRVVPEGKSFRIIVDFEEALPAEWVGRVGFNLELFPGNLFGKSYLIGDKSGIFPRQYNDGGTRTANPSAEVLPMGKGNMLSIAPESEQLGMLIQSATGQPVELFDGRALHSNGWFVVRSLVPAGATKNAINWLVTPSVQHDWMSQPVIQYSQAGYHPGQKKIAVIELDRKDKTRYQASLHKIKPGGGMEKVLETKPVEWGDFLRYHYLQFDFSSIKEPGVYILKYGKTESGPVRIDAGVYHQDVWQPTLFYFLPIQMCHMRVEDRYKVWHGLCHADDALMAPVSLNHFDGYLQGPSTLCKYQPGEHVPGLDHGGWHDAGDYDLRIESQAETVLGLAQAYELFQVKEDNTTIDQTSRVARLNVPDGKPDILQQVEHGCLTIVGGYRSLGRLYRGIICPTLQQYVMLGDPVNNTDNMVNHPAVPDDNRVFTEDNPGRELNTAGCLAAASRVMKGFNDTLSLQCLQIAEELWVKTKERFPLQRLSAAVQLLKTTGKKEYADWILSQKDLLVKQARRTAGDAGQVLQQLNDPEFTTAMRSAVKAYRSEIDSLQKINPYGVPYKPDIWGAGWNIQGFGVDQYFLHTSYPDIFPDTWMLQSLSFILGCHPGPNNASFASGVGSNSVLVAYGYNRDEWSYLPGGIVSGTALIRPDYPELLEWPFLWQQTEYVLGGGTTDYLLLVLAADKLLNQ
ncbi:MAG: glycoside hydrolase family 9 protein [Bacteroidales bacterium]